MSQQINPEKLKAAAEHLEWVCQQYPNNEDVQGLYRGLQSMIEDAKAGRILLPVENRQKIPGWYFNHEGVYQAYTDPDVEGAYVKFAIEMEGGLTEEDKEINAQIVAMAQEMLQGNQPKEDVKNNNLNLTDEQQTIFDRVMGIVTLNNQLRHQFKTAIEELHKQPNWDDVEYMFDSDELPAVNARLADDAIDAAIEHTEPNLRKSDSRLFYEIRSAICKDFRKN